MAALIESFTPRRQAFSFDDWVGLYNPENLGLMLQTTQPNEPEHVDSNFEGFAAGLYLRNSIVFACLSLRARLFSEARFQFQQMRAGRPGRLFGTADLAVLERPQPGWTTRDLLQRVILDADLAGASFSLGRKDRIRHLRPSWMTIAYGVRGERTPLGSWDPDAEIIGFGYYPGGITSGVAPEVYGPDEIAFFAPHKNPLTGSGVSLLVAALREVMADTASTTHKLNFFNHSATPNLALTFPKEWDKTIASDWIELFEQEHRGATNAWKTIYLGNGITPVPVGLNFQQMDYKKIQGHAETRIAALTGMHPVVAGFSEGLAGSALNEGNYSSARRNVGDTVLRPLWGDIASSLETIVPPLPGTRLWFDDREIAFLRDDVKDQAEVLQKNATTITGLIVQGFEPAAVVDAVVANDLSRLQNAHTGLVSVQLQPPGTALPAGTTPAAYRVRREFWTADEPFRKLGTVPSGIELPGDHLLVTEFPSLFEPIEQVRAYEVQRPALGSGPTEIVSRQEILDKRTELQANGKPAGYDSLARELRVSRDTIRRRLRTD
jgi:phage portal protein BeeE